ncbi:signal peptide protein, YSIRK family [Aerococcus christensenii]|uniref:Signal peptide protein, YSIRK family n=2 Tax=Aerococcus christensenii TaxID=87541 RepID=A0A133XZK4_9LACT|nr:signal peptide protein, YSIRK family [Aerococcus christensenii]
MKMVSKNNRRLQEEKQAQKKDKFSIRKLKVGAASVVIGASLFFGGFQSQSLKELL